MAEKRYNHLVACGSIGIYHAHNCSKNGIMTKFRHAHKTVRPACILTPNEIGEWETVWGAVITLGFDRNNRPFVAYDDTAMGWMVYGSQEGGDDSSPLINCYLPTKELAEQYASRTIKTL